MGTNYYWHKKVPVEGATTCPTCGHCPSIPMDPVHIGKSSVGWTFSFHATDDIRSWKAWREELQTPGIIKDEYGDLCTFEEFVEMIDAKAARPNALKHAQDTGFSRGDYLDEEGHSFSPGYFS